jgi:hypothetical protein
MDSPKSVEIGKGFKGNLDSLDIDKSETESSIYVPR